MLETDPATLLRWRQAIDRRKSVRRFTGGPLDRETVAALEGACAGCTHLPGGRVRVVPVNGLDAARRIFRWLPWGIARFIHQASLTFVILSSGGPYDPEDAGFCGEQVVLEACSRDAGTCWVSGTFSRRAALSLAGAAPGEHVMCVIAAGRAHPSAASRHKHKKDFSEICNRLPEELPAWLRDAVDCARVSPSGNNLQPWWFEVRDGAAAGADGGLGVSTAAGPVVGRAGGPAPAPRVMLWRDRPGPAALRSGFLLSRVGPRRIDRGIAMLHFAVGAEAGGVAGNWILGLDEERGVAARFLVKGQGHGGRKTEAESTGHGVYDERRGVCEGPGSQSKHH